MVQIVLDVLRGTLAYVLMIIAVGAIFYFVVPGVAEESLDPWVRRVARGRSMVAMFGGLSLLVLAMVAAAAVTEHFR